MKHLFIFLFLSSIINAQDSRLFENNWYLSYLTIDNINNFPPTNIVLSFYQPNSRMETEGICNTLFGEIIYEQNNFSDFLYTNFYQTLAICSENYNYESIYFQFFTENGPANTFTYIISEVDDVRILEIYSAFNKKATYSSKSLSTINFENLNFRIFPNPTTDIINIKFEKQNIKNARVEIYNSLGKLCRSENIISNLTKIDINNLPSGVYWIKIQANNEAITKKYIKL